MNNNQIVINNKEIKSVFEDIKDLVIDSRNKVYSTVNVEMLRLYWNIGKMILEIQNGDEKASYGESVLERLSGLLTKEFGRGFSKRNLERMRKLYLCFPNATTLSSELSWSHYLELLKIDDKNKRDFYLKETINSNWSVRELQRQKNSLFYERLILSKDKENVKKLSNEGYVVNTGVDLVKDPFVLEFLDIKENVYYLVMLLVN